MTADLGTNGGRNLTAMTLWSWERVFGAPMQRVLDPSAIPVVNRLAEECIESAFDIMVRRQTAKPLEDRFLSVANPVDLEPWRSLAASNTAGVLPRGMPVFLAQGGDDQLVQPEITNDYMRRLCQAGSPVRFLVLPGVNHGFIGRDSAGAAVEWMAERFAHAAPPSNCP